MSAKPLNECGVVVLGGSAGVYLAGPAARRITGQAISINGGISVA